LTTETAVVVIRTVWLISICR